MSKKKGADQDPLDENRGVEDILGGLLGANAGGVPQGGGNQPSAGGSGDLMGMLGGLMGGGAQGAGGSGDLMGMLGGLMGSGAQGSAGGDDLMGMLGGLLGGQSGNSSVSANAPSILSALLPLVLGMLGGGGKRSGGIDLDQRTSTELNGMFGAAKSGALNVSQVRSSGVVQNVAAQTGAPEDEVADTLAQLMRVLGNQG
jgi:hypothetical protein